MSASHPDLSVPVPVPHVKSAKRIYSVVLTLVLKAEDNDKWFGLYMRGDITLT